MPYCAALVTICAKSSGAWRFFGFASCRQEGVRSIYATPSTPSPDQKVTFSGTTYYAVAHGASVINLALGESSPDANLQAVLKNASSHGVIVCSAAGNEGGATPDYPASYAQGIAVGASQQSGFGFSLASFSNRAGTSSSYNFVDAPGVNIKSYGLGNSIGNWTGTSMATPLVAAEAADLLSAHSSLSVEQIVQDIVHGTVALVGVSSLSIHA